MAWTRGHDELRRTADIKLSERHMEIGARNIAALLARRRKGEWNDERSLLPGITAYLMWDEGWATKLASRSEGAYVYDLKEVDGMDPDVRKFALDHGGFFDDGAAIGLHTYFDPGDSPEQAMNWLEGENYLLVRVPHEFVVRVEGSSGELWQNPKYLTDGYPSGWAAMTENFAPAN